LKTEDDFRELLDFVHELQFEKPRRCSTYSIREDTPRSVAQPWSIGSAITNARDELMALQQ